MSFAKFKMKALHAAPGVFTAVSLVGLVATVVTTIIATRKHEQDMDDYEDRVYTNLSNADEKAYQVKSIVKNYAVPAAIGVATGVSMVCAHKFSKKEFLTLAGYYATLTKSFSNYNKNKDKYLDSLENFVGKDTVKKVREQFLKNEIKSKRIPKKDLDDEKKLFYDDFLGEFIEITENQLFNAAYEINYILAKNGSVSLNEYYNALGMKPIDAGDVFGWSYTTLWDQIESLGQSGIWIEVELEEYDLEDGMTAVRIIFPYAPVKGFEE